MDDGIDGSGLSIEIPTTVFGDDTIDGLGPMLENRGIDRPLIVSDAGIDSAGILDRALSTIFTPYVCYEATTEPAVTDFQELPSEPVDGLVAIGGGSCLDTAKVLAILLANGGSPADYLGEGTVPGPLAPIVAVPTTSGTGSQATQSAVVSHQGIKRGISDEALRPAVAVVDPTVTIGLPATITARSGFDAFVHALESFLARDYRAVADRPIRYQGANPVTRPLSRQALLLVYSSLEIAVDDGTDVGARRAMSLGAHLAGVAFSNSGLGAVHALASSVGGMTGRPHGECLAASITAGLSYNRPERESSYARLASELGLVPPETLEATAADKFQAACRDLAESLGLPTTFSAIGLGPDDTDEILEKTLVQDRRLRTNPRPVTAELRSTIAAAFD